MSSPLAPQEDTTQMMSVPPAISGSKPPPAMMNGFHPDYMFCGECTDCNAAPEPPEDEVTIIRTKLTLTHSWNSPHHVLLIQSLLQPLGDVTKVLVDLPHGCIYVDHKLTLQDSELTNVLKQGGYPCKVEATHEATDLMEDEMLQDPEQEICKSVLFVKGICCASEVPSVRKIVKPIPGVQSLQINITTKRVFVFHAPSEVSIQAVADKLTREGFHATIITNGAATSLQLPSTNSTVGRSTLHVNGTLHQQDVDRIQSLLRSIRGVQRIGVNVPESVIYVEHDVTVLAAADLPDLLKPAYDTSLVLDGQAEIQDRVAQVWRQPRSKYVETTLVVVESLASPEDADRLRAYIHQNCIRPQVRAVHIVWQSHVVKIEHQPSLMSTKKLVDLLRADGWTPTIATDGVAEKLFLPLVEEEEDEETSEAKRLVLEFDSNNLQWHVWISGVFWLTAMVGGFLDEPNLEYMGIISAAFGLPSVALKAWRTVRRCGFDANCMMVTAAIGALLLGEWDEAASVSFLFCVSEFLEHRATNRARKALEEIVNLRPDHAHVLHPETKELAILPANQVPVGSLVRVRTGDKIAADGVIVEGTSTVDESSLTGESLPVRKQKDDMVAGGSINVGSSPLTVKTTCSVEDSAVSRLVRLVEEASANISPTEKMIDAFARAYTPAVVSVALILCTIPWLWGTEIGREWTLNGLIIIVVACPCALTISTPVTYAAGLAAAAQRGIIVKGGSSLESLGNVTQVVFDKTGTLTEGKFNVVHLEDIGDTRSRKEMLGLLALMESPSSHPLSSTLVKAAKREGVDIPTNMKMEDHSVLKGEGVSAKVDGKQVYVGNKRLFERVGMMQNLGNAYLGLANEWTASGGTVGFVGVENEGIVGAFCLTDMVREDAEQTISTLRSCGVDVIMLTGDSHEAALSVAEQVGLPESAVHAQLTPEDKLHFVGSLKTPPPTTCCEFLNRNAQVVFCGDGINDCPSLAVADVGVAMGEGASLALEMSDVTLMDSSLGKLIYVINMGCRVVATIKENIALSLICKLVVVGLTFYSKMTLLYAIASDVGVMLLVTLNGMKLLPGHHRISAKVLESRKKNQELLPLAGSKSAEIDSEII